MNNSTKRVILLGMMILAVPCKAFVQPFVRVATRGFFSMPRWSSMIDWIKPHIVPLIHTTAVLAVADAVVVDQKNVDMASYGASSVAGCAGDSVIKENKKLVSLDWCERAINFCKGATGQQKVGIAVSFLITAGLVSYVLVKRYRTKKDANI